MSVAHPSSTRDQKADVSRHCGQRGGGNKGRGIRWGLGLDISPRAISNKTEAVLRAFYSP